MTTTYAGGLYEKRSMPTGEVLHVFYIPSGERIVAQDTWIEKPAGVFARADVLYLHDDVIGSIVGVTSAQRNTAVYRYDPYGARITATNPALSPALPVTSFSHPGTGTFYTMNLGFTGHEMDDEVGLINMKGRMYDPKLGRFLTPDPVTQSPFMPAGWDRYAYAINQPLRYTDPSGFALGFDPWLLMGYGMQTLMAYIGNMDLYKMPATAPGKETGPAVPGGGSGNPLNDRRIPPPPGSGPLPDDQSPGDTASSPGNSPWGHEPFTGSLLSGTPGRGGGGGGGAGHDDSGALRRSSGGGSGVASPRPNMAGMGFVGVDDAIIAWGATVIAGEIVIWWGTQPATRKLAQDIGTRISEWRIKAPGAPTGEDGWEAPKNWDGKRVKAPSGTGYGWPDRIGRVWVPTGEGGHGGPHWDVEYPDGSYENVYPKK